MKDIITSNGWTIPRSNSRRTFFFATDKRFTERTVELEVFKGDTIISDRVLVNGERFSDHVIPTVEEAKDFLDSLADN